MHPARGGGVYVVSVSERRWERVRGRPPQVFSDGRRGELDAAKAGSDKGATVSSGVWIRIK